MRPRLGMSAYYQKRRVGGRTSHGLTLPGGIAYSYVYLLVLTYTQTKRREFVARSDFSGVRGNLLYRGSHC